MKYGRKIESWIHLYGYQVINDKNKCNYYEKNEYKVYYKGAGKQKHILSIKYGKEIRNCFVAKEFKAC